MRCCSLVVDTKEADKKLCRPPLESLQSGLLPRLPEKYLGQKRPNNMRWAATRQVARCPHCIEQNKALQVLDPQCFCC